MAVLDNKERDSFVGLQSQGRASRRQRCGVQVEDGNDLYGQRRKRSQCKRRSRFVQKRVKCSWLKRGLRLFEGNKMNIFWLALLSASPVTADTAINVVAIAGRPGVLSVNGNRPQDLILIKENFVGGKWHEKFLCPKSFCLTDNIQLEDTGYKIKNVTNQDAGQYCLLVDSDFNCVIQGFFQVLSDFKWDQSGTGVSFKTAGPLRLWQCQEHAQLINNSACNCLNDTVRCIVDKDLPLKFVGPNESSPAVYVLTVPSSSSLDENEQSRIEDGNDSIFKVILFSAVVLGLILFWCIFNCVMCLVRVLIGKESLTCPSFSLPPSGQPLW